MKHFSLKSVTLAVCLLATAIAARADVGDTWEEGTGGGLTFSTRYFFTLKIVSTSPRQCVIQSYSGPTDEGLNWEGAVKFEASYSHGLVSYDVVGIEPAAFANAKITSVEFTDATNLTYIGNYAFQNCSNLESIDLEDATNITSIGNYAFSGCSKLTKIFLPYSLSNLGTYAFRNCSKLKEVRGGTGKSGDAHYYTLGALPPYVINIPEGTFYGCSSIDSLLIHRNATTIGSYAFYGCSKLQKVKSYYNTGTTTIAKYPEGYLPLNINTIGQYAFMNCHALSKLYLPEGLTAINAHTFQNDTLLTDFGKFYLNTANNTYTYTNNTLPETVTTIGTYAFYNTRLSNLMMSDNVTSVGSSAFENSRNLRYVRLSSQLTSLPYSVFYGCSNLSYVYNGTNITEIGSYAFGRCASMQTVNLQNSIYFGKVQTIGNNAFRDCSALQNVVLADNTSAIYSYAFSDCANLRYVDLRANLKTIGEYAFQNCSNLPKIQFPETLEGVYNNAFDGCSALKLVDASYTADPAVFADNAFDNNAKASARLYVPLGSETAYHASSTMGGFNYLIANVCEEGFAEVFTKGSLPVDNYSFHYRISSGDTDFYPGVFSNGDQTYALNTMGISHPTCPDGLTEYPGINLLNGSKGYQYDITNWIAFENVDFAGKTLNNGATFALVNKTNPTLRFDSGYDINDGGTGAAGYTPVTSLATTDSDVTYTANAYCAASFGNQTEYWFVQPQPCEYATIRWAVYGGNNTFYAPAKTMRVSGNNINEADLKGAFTIDDSMLDNSAVFNVGSLYDFTAVVKRTDSANGAPLRDGNYPYDNSTAPNSNFVVLPISITEYSPDVFTGIADSRTAKAIVSVRYINPSGLSSDKPLSGLNIVETRYTDGTVTTIKQTR